MAVLICPQARLDAVVVGDGDDIERHVLFNVIQYLLNAVDAIAHVGVDVQVGTTIQALHNKDKPFDQGETLHLIVHLCGVRRGKDHANALRRTC
jgi:hypothetical protein